MPTLVDQKDLTDLKFVLQQFWVPRIYTVIRYVERNIYFSFRNELPLFIYFIFNRNLIPRQVKLSLVVVSDLVKRSTNISNAMLSIITVATKICATMIQLVPVLNHTNNIKK